MDTSLPHAATPPSRWEDPSATEHTIRTYFHAFGPTPAWEQLVQWPADVYCLCSLVLDQTEAYRFAVAPPPGRRWPPRTDWNAHVETSAHGWASGSLPWFVRRPWSVLSQARDTRLSAIRAGDAWEVCEALLTLHALADEAYSGLAAPRYPAEMADRMWRSWSLLGREGTLSNVSSRRVRVLPKTNSAARGITIRSMSRYLALCYESVDVHWGRVESELRALDAAQEERPYTAMLVPWPRTVRARDFHPIPGPLENMDDRVFGFFEFAPEESLSGDYLASLLEAPALRGTTVDAVVLPEAALAPDQIPTLEKVLEGFGVRFLIAGIRQAGHDGEFGRNYVHFGVRSDGDWQRYEQDKHHRWLLDRTQIHQYRLASSLDPSKLWWEGIDLRPRALNVIDVGGWRHGGAPGVRGPRPDGRGVGPAQADRAEHRGGGPPRRPSACQPMALPVRLRAGGRAWLSSPDAHRIRDAAKVTPRRPASQSGHRALERQGFGHPGDCPVTWSGGRAPGDDGAAENGVDRRRAATRGSAGGHPHRIAPDPTFANPALNRMGQARVPRRGGGPPSRRPVTVPGPGGGGRSR